MTDAFPSEFLQQEHSRIAAAAVERGVRMRLLGALAFERRCPRHGHLRRALGRQLSDLDYVALSRQWEQIVALLTALGYSFDERRAMLHGLDRVIFFHPSGLRVDIFFDRLDMCHLVDLRDRLGVDSDTIPLADMLLEKLQIVHLTEKDIIDVLVLLLEHPVTTTDEGVNGDYIARRLAYDWGFYHTATTNLERIRDEFLGRYDQLGAEKRRVIGDRIGELLARVVSEPKTLKWKARAAIGTAVRWYKEVGELAR